MKVNNNFKISRKLLKTNILYFFYFYFYSKKIVFIFKFKIGINLNFFIKLLFFIIK